MVKKKKKNDKREYTLMLVPNQGEKVRSIHIPIVVAKYTIALLGLLAVVTVGSLFHYRSAVNNANSEKVELVQLRQNNGAQHAELEELIKKTAILQSDMERLNSLDAEIRRIINNEDMANTSRAGTIRLTATHNGQGGANVKPDINNISNLINELQVTIKVREDSLATLKEELLAKQVKIQSTPSIWPASGDVTSRFGGRNSPFGGGSDWHPGIDIANSTGTAVMATASGEVTISEYYGGYGNMVEINHGNGIVTLYGHNSQLLVQVGEKVKKGQVIAYMGNTGYSTGSHVHYEVRVNGTAVNPVSFLN